MGISVTLESLVSIQNSSCNICLDVASVGVHLVFACRERTDKKKVRTDLISLIENDQIFNREMKLRLAVS